MLRCSCSFAGLVAVGLIAEGLYRKLVARGDTIPSDLAPIVIFAGAMAIIFAVTASRSHRLLQPTCPPSSCSGWLACSCPSPRSHCPCGQDCRPSSDLSALRPPLSN